MQRFVSITLLLVLSLMVLKNLLPSVGSAAEDCRQFGHIHWMKLIKQTHEIGKTWKESGERDQDCQSAQSLFAYSALPAKVFEFTNALLLAPRKYLSNVAQPLASPDLDPPRRPPRA
jgi:hypothetical protein